jgi:hypothetical protein
MIVRGGIYEVMKIDAPNRFNNRVSEWNYDGIIRDVLHQNETDCFALYAKHTSYDQD